MPRKSVKEADQKVCDKRRRLEDYLDSRRLYEELNQLMTQRERERDFNRLVREIAT